MLKRTVIALALAASGVVPALAQQANYCSSSGYVEGGAVSDRDFDHRACDPAAVPRVNGVPQDTPQPTARRGYNNNYPNRQAAQQNSYQGYGSPYDGRYDRRYEQRYDPRYMGNRDRDWERYHDGPYYYGARGPEWRRGAHMPREYMARQYWVEDWRAHRLAPPPRGYQWVQVGNDYVLVALATGIIAQLLLAQ